MTDGSVPVPDRGVHSTKGKFKYTHVRYPIVRSEDLCYDQPVKVRALGVDHVAFRDKKGDAVVLSDTCTHRGASLGGA